MKDYLYRYIWFGSKSKPLLISENTYQIKAYIHRNGCRYDNTHCFNIVYLQLDVTKVKDISINEFYIDDFIKIFKAELENTEKSDLYNIVRIIEKPKYYYPTKYEFEDFKSLMKRIINVKPQTKTI